MSIELELSIYVFFLAVVLGLELVHRVSPLLHTPLHVAQQCHLGHLGGWRTGYRGLRQCTHVEPGTRLHRGNLFHHKRRRRLPYYRSHAQNVQKGAYKRGSR